MFKNYLILKYLIIGSTPNQAQEPVIIDKGYNFIPKEIEEQSIFINENINNIIK